MVRDAALRGRTCESDLHQGMRPLRSSVAQMVWGMQLHQVGVRFSGTRCGAGRASFAPDRLASALQLVGLRRSWRMPRYSAALVTDRPDFPVICAARARMKISIPPELVQLVTPNLDISLQLQTS